MSEPSPNIDPGEVAKFEHLASRWWDTAGDFKPLHDINPLRLNYIDQHSPLAGKRVLDVGCGGGILSESMAARDATVTGIDAAPAPLAVARLHSLESGVEVEYLDDTAEAHAEQRAGQYDVVTCLEMLEHVPEPASVVRACARLVKPDGHVYFSTINRNPKAYLFAVIGAEYVLRLLPKGTHDYAKFIQPAELEQWARAAHLRFAHMTGMSYNPFSDRYWLGSDIDVNYLVHAVIETDTDPTGG